jgi:hypothetical protein
MTSLKGLISGVYLMMKSIRQEIRPLVSLIKPLTKKPQKTSDQIWEQANEHYIHMTQIKFVIYWSVFYSR